jgi:3',5'-cyclic AMP phosphodiesterase CpdA
MFAKIISVGLFTLGSLLICGTSSAQGPLNEIAFDLLSDREPSVSEAYNVAVIADAHIDPLGDGNPDNFEGSYLKDMLEQFYSWENTSNEIAFVIMAGDFIHSYCTGDPNSLFEYYDNIGLFMYLTGIPVFHAIGNHESGGNEYGDYPDPTTCYQPAANMFDNYFDYFGETDYYIDFGVASHWNDRFVITSDAEYIVSTANSSNWCSVNEWYEDTCTISDPRRSIYSSGYRFSILDDQLDLVETALAANNRFEFGIVHLPVKSGYNDNGKNDMDANDDYREILGYYGVSAVICGHTHTPQKIQQYYDPYNYFWHITADDNQSSPSPRWFRLKFTSLSPTAPFSVIGTFCTNAPCTTNGGSWIIDHL